MEGILITSVLSSIGLGISSFFGFFLLKNSKLENRLLAWLLIALSLRITKSIFYTHIELPLVIKNLGLAANLAVGPLLFLYISILLGKQKLHRLDGLHFIPAIGYFLLSPLLPNGGDNNFWIISYSLILMQSFTYVGLSAFCLTKNRMKVGNKHIKWASSLTAGLFFMWLIYALIFLKFLPLYALGSVSFSILIFILLFVALNHQKLFKGSASRYLNSRLSDKEGKAHFSNLQQLILEEQLYKSSDLSLATLASKMNLLERDVSLIINKYGNCNFSQFVNQLRIEEAKKLIKVDPKQKIISIAFDSGFNNLGTFNNVFKSTTGSTPSEFRKSLS
ncbi:helix-turn-helix domain-containing protein [Ekhidna sp. To15]|uniref:helix-turn-helix domain-containing protein n=1 Tax=Ekhidna sp. To15 TaxID=3395267 RepID=UPI003F5257FF